MNIVKMSKKMKLLLVSVTVAALPVAAIVFDSSNTTSAVSAPRSSTPQTSPSPSPSNPPASPRKVVSVRSDVRDIAVHTSQETNPAPAARQPVRPAATPKVTTLSPVTAIRSQKMIDRGRLVTWMTSPTCLIAGHDTMGWAWLDNVPTGRTVVVKTGPCTGTYKVVGHKWQPVKGGSVPAWMTNYDLILQTCTGRSGMGFSVLKRT